MPSQLLVVDERAGVRDALLALLFRSGYGVTEADSGDAALRILKSPRPLPDLILLDLMMPQLTCRDGALGRE